jgi:energy-converting hydrogenase Eha subunit A
MNNGYGDLPKFPGDVTDTSTLESMDSSAPAESKWVAVRQSWPVYVVFACVFVALALTAIILAVAGLPEMAFLVAFVAVASVFRMFLFNESTDLWHAFFSRKGPEDRR